MLNFTMRQKKNKIPRKKSMDFSPCKFMYILHNIYKLTLQYLDVF